MRNVVTDAPVQIVVAVRNDLSAPNDPNTWSDRNALNDLSAPNDLSALNDLSATNDLSALNDLSATNDRNARNARNDRNVPTGHPAAHEEIAKARYRVVSGRPPRGVGAVKTRGQHGYATTSLGCQHTSRVSAAGRTKGVAPKSKRAMPISKIAMR